MEDLNNEISFYKAHFFQRMDWVYSSFCYMVLNIHLVNEYTCLIITSFSSVLLFIRQSGVKPNWEIVTYKLELIKAAVHCISSNKKHCQNFSNSSLLNINELADNILLWKTIKPFFLVRLSSRKKSLLQKMAKDSLRLSKKWQIFHATFFKPSY